MLILKVKYNQQSFTFWFITHLKSFSNKKKKKKKKKRKEYTKKNFFLNELMKIKALKKLKYIEINKRKVSVDNLVIKV